MVDGVHGAMDHVVRHVEEEQEHKSVLECVMILLLPVEEIIAQVQMRTWFHVTPPTAVLVRLRL